MFSWILLLLVSIIFFFTWSSFFKKWYNNTLPYFHSLPLLLFLFCCFCNYVLLLFVFLHFFCLFFPFPLSLISSYCFSPCIVFVSLFYNLRCKGKGRCEKMIEFEFKSPLVGITCIMGIINSISNNNYYYDFICYEFL